jgi:hypothetical protein
MRLWAKESQDRWLDVGQRETKRKSAGSLGPYANLEDKESLKPHLEKQEFAKAKR